MKFGMVFPAALIVAAFVTLPATTWGQQRYQSPYSPSLSPYMDYFRTDPGVVSPYHQYVRPRQALDQRLREQQAGIGRVERQVGQLQMELRAGGAQDMMAPSPIAPTGRVPTYMNYLHYYPGARQRR